MWMTGINFEKASKQSSSQGSNYINSLRVSLTIALTAKAALSVGCAGGCSKIMAAALRAHVRLLRLCCFAGANQFAPSAHAIAKVQSCLGCR